MAAYLSPIGNEMQADANGAPLVGGKIYTYLAGTSTLAATYTSSAGVTPQANPIILNSLGLAASPVWLGAGVSMKLVIKDSSDVTIRTIDDVLGINDPSAVTAQDQWVTYSGTPTYISATSFSVAGDQTGTFQAFRRLKTANSGGTVYSTIASGSFGAGVTTVTVVNDSGTLDAGLSTVSYGLLSSLNPSIPVNQPAFRATRTSNQSAVSGVSTKVQLPTETFDTNGFFDNATNYRFTPTVAGYYQINGAVYVTGTAVTALIVSLQKNGVDFAGAFHTTGATGDHKLSASDVVLMNGSTDYVELWGSGTGTTVNFGTGSYLSGVLVRRL